MLRATVVALLAANLVVFAWMNGWLGFLEPVLPFLAERPDAQREPERLARQVQPERLRLIPQEAPLPTGRPPRATGSGSSSQVAAPANGVAACFEAGPYAGAALEAAQGVLQAALPAGSWEARSVEAAPGYWVAMGPFGDGEALLRKRGELSRRGLTHEEVGPASARTLVLSRHGTQAEAEAELRLLAERNVRTAQVMAAPAELQQALRIAAADGAMQDSLRSLNARLPSPGFARCANGAAS